MTSGGTSGGTLLRKSTGQSDGIIAGRDPLPARRRTAERRPSDLTRDEVRAPTAEQN